MPTLFECDIQEEEWLERASQRNGASDGPARKLGANGGTAEIADAGPWEPAVIKMVEFQHLADNWDGQGARAPSRELLASAIGLAYALYEQGMDPPSRVVPGLEGSVIFEWQDADGTYAEVEIVRPLYAEVMSIQPGQPAKHWTLPTK